MCDVRLRVRATATACDCDCDCDRVRLCACVLCRIIVDPPPLLLRVGKKAMISFFQRASTFTPSLELEPDATLQVKGPLGMVLDGDYLSLDLEAGAMLPNAAKMVKSMGTKTCLFVHSLSGAQLPKFMDVFAKVHPVSGGVEMLYICMGICVPLQLSDYAPNFKAVMVGGLTFKFDQHGGFAKATTLEYCVDARKYDISKGDPNITWFQPSQLELLKVSRTQSVAHGQSHAVTCRTCTRSRTLHVVARARSQARPQSRAQPRELRTQSHARSRRRARTRTQSLAGGHMPLPAHTHTDWHAHAWCCPGLL